MLSNFLSGAASRRNEMGGATGFTSSGFGNVDDMDVNLPVNSTVIFTITANVSQTVTGAVGNTVTVTQPLE